MQLCAADVNTGFPVVLRGSIDTRSDNYKKVAAEPEIYSAFSSYTGFPEMITQVRAETQSVRRNLINIPNMNQNTLNYKGAIYALEHIQICESQQQNIIFKSIGGTHNAACVFSFVRNAGSGPDGIILTVPLFEKETLEDISLSTPKAQMFFNDLAIPAAQRPARPQIQSLQTIFSNMIYSVYYYYSSCILTRSSPNSTRPLSYIGLYFPGGWILPKAIIEQIGNYTYENANRYAPFYIPNIMRFSYPVAKNEYNRNTTPAVYVANADTWSTNGQTYAQSISVDSDTFIKRIRFVEKGLIGLENSSTRQNRLKTTAEYQCLPLDKIRDIDGRNVLLDPATGKRTLADAILGTEEQQASLNTTIQVNTSGIEIFAVNAGYITAIILIVVLFGFLVKYLMARQGTPEGAAALKAVVPNPGTSST